MSTITAPADAVAVQPRMTNPAQVLPGAFDAIQALSTVAFQAGVPKRTLHLVHLRASQINGCGFCVDYGTKDLVRSGESPERMMSVAAWRETPYFTAAERAALALAEEATRLSDRSDAVSDAVWEEATRQFDERQLAAIVLWIATTNFYNRLNVTTRQPAGIWG